MRRRYFLAGAFGAALPGAAFGQGLQTRPITPENALEYAFTQAFENEIYRPAFRRMLMVQNVTVAMASGAANAAPRQVTLQNNVSAAAVFTSPTRLTSVLGANAVGVTMTGREAMTRLTGQNVVLNYRLIPMLTLEPADVARLLAPEE